MVGVNLHVLQSATGIGRGPDCERQRVHPHRGGRISAFGLRCKTCRSDVGGYAGRDRLPARGAALIDIEFGVRTANADNGNHLGRVADQRGKLRVRRLHHPLELTARATKVVHTVAHSEPSSRRTVLSSTPSIADVK